MSVYNLRPYIGDIPLIGGYNLEPYTVDSGTIQRNFTTLDSAFSMSYTVPDIPLQIGDKVRITFVAPVAPANYSVLFDTFDNVDRAMFSFWDDDKFFYIGFSDTAILDGVSYDMLTENYPTDGKQHTIELTCDEAGRCIDSIGNSSSLVSYTGILSNFEVERASTIIRNYKIDETWVGPSTTLVDYGTDSSNGTAVNIDTDDSEPFTFDGDVSPNTWTNDGATIVIEVAGT